MAYSVLVLVRPTFRQTRQNFPNFCSLSCSAFPLRTTTTTVVLWSPSARVLIRFLASGHTRRSRGLCSRSRTFPRRIVAPQSLSQPPAGVSSTNVGLASFFFKGGRGSSSCSCGVERLQVLSRDRFWDKPGTRFCGTQLWGGFDADGLWCGEGHQVRPANLQESVCV